MLTSKIIKIFISILSTFAFSQGAWAQQCGVKGYPIYYVNLEDGDTPAIPLELKGAKNENLFVVFAVKGAQPGDLQVTLQPRGSTVGVQYKVWQIRPVPVDLPPPFLWDGLVPLGSNLVIPINPFLIGLSVDISQDHPSGRHAYELLFRSGRNVFRQPLNLQVFKFTLPGDLPIAILGLFWPNQSWFRRYCPKSTEIFDTIYESYLRLLRDYKFNATNLFSLPAQEVAAGKQIADYPKFAWQIDLVNRLGYRFFRVPSLPANRINQPGDRFKELAPIYYGALYKYLQARGLADKALVKVWDEPSPEDIPRVLQAYSIVKQAAKQFRTESAGRAPDLSLARVINIWVTYGRNYDSQRVAAARRQGQEIWFYANYLHGAKQPSVDQRMIGWYLFAKDFSGYLVWGVNFWDVDPWTKSPSPEDYGRRGVFVYPDPSTGLPLPTLRLEAMRRGFEDYQYLVLLREAAGQGKVDAAAYARIKAQVAEVAGNPNNNNPQASWHQLEEIRLQIGELLDRAAGGGNG